MATATHPNPQGVHMDYNLAPETPAQELARIQAKFPKWGPARVLSAMGHPNYGTDFARKALALVAQGNVSTHQAVYGLMGR